MKEAKRSSSGFTHRQSYKSKKTYSKPSSLSQTFLTPFSHKSIVLGIVIIAIIIGGFVLSQGPLFHSNIIPNPYSRVNDPISYIWRSTLALNDLSEFNTFRALYFLDVTNKTIGLLPNATFTAVALTKTTIDFSTISGKQLYALFDWSIAGLCCNPGRHWGVYLTTNGTVPTQPFYNPYDDAQVALIMANQNEASTTYLTRLHIQRGETQPISLGYTGICGVPTSDCFLSTSYSNATTKMHNVINEFILNFTGTVNSNTSCNSLGVGSGCSTLAIDSFRHGAQSTNSSTQIIPQFNFQAKSYYVGFYASYNLGVNSPQILFQYDSSASPSSCSNSAGNSGQSCNEINLYVPSPTPAIAPPNIDTGGFFGPIIRALISIGVFIAQNLINFMNFLNSIFAPLLAIVIAIFGGVFVAVFNALGGIFGDGSLGSQMGTFLSNLSTYFANAFSQQIAFIGTAVNFLVNSFAVTSSFFSGANAFIALWTTLLSGIGSLVGVLNTFLGTLLYFYNLGVFGFNIIIILLVSILCVSAVLDWIQTDNALSGFIAIVLTFFLLFVLQTSNSSLNVVATNATILTQYQNAWNYTLFFVKLAPVLFFAMFIEWIAGLDETQRVVHGGQEFMPNFQSMLRFDIMLTTDIFKGGYWAFNQAYFIITAGITAIKGRWSPVEVAGTG